MGVDAEHATDDEAGAAAQQPPLRLHVDHPPRRRGRRGRPSEPARASAERVEVARRVRFERDHERLLVAAVARALRRSRRGTRRPGPGSSPSARPRRAARPSYASASSAVPSAEPSSTTMTRLPSGKSDGASLEIGEQPWEVLRLVVRRDRRRRAGRSRSAAAGAPFASGLDVLSLRKRSTPLVRAPLAEHDRDRLAEDLQVPPERPVRHVEVVELDHLVERDVVAAEHLPEARDARASCRGGALAQPVIWSAS